MNKYFKRNSTKKSLEEQKIVAPGLTVFNDILPLIP